MENANERNAIKTEDVKGRRRHYETIYIISPVVNDTEAKELAQKNVSLIENFKGQILRNDEWGKKRMAHPIEKHQMGRYQYTRFIGTAEALREFERSLKLDARVIRFQTVCLSGILTEEEASTLIEKAPREVSTAPSVRQDEEELDQAFASQA